MARSLLFMAFIFAVAFSVSHSTPVTAQDAVNSDLPRFGTDNELARPENYREWIYLSSGLGMSYNAAANAPGNPNPPFDNVLVSPAESRSFFKIGS